MVRTRRQKKTSDDEDEDYNPAADLPRRGKKKEELKVVEEKTVSLVQLKNTLRKQVGNDDFLPEFQKQLRRAEADSRLVSELHDELFSIVESNPDSLGWSRKVFTTVNEALLEYRKRLRDAMFFPSEESLNKLIAYLNSARRTLEVCIFTITNNRLANALRRAKDRGVEVRVISDDANLEMLGSDVRELLTYGIPVKVDADLKSHMHNKFVLIDDNVLMTGSFNWTVQAVKKNQENLAAVEDPVLVGLFKEEFEKLWRQFNPPKPQVVAPVVQPPVVQPPVVEPLDST
jgi:phosphatidylserine/phosphatidylglycerophosphate/cardiolipin synthase-like enzyme